MDYGSLIRQAWTITWRYRFLWLLGVLAGVQSDFRPSTAVAAAVGVLTSATFNR